jgi:hypothetical protein
MDYEIYRDGASDLKSHLQASIRAFYERHGCLPESVIVSPTVVERAAEDLQALDLPNLVVTKTGGCLAGEVWLGVEETHNGESKRQREE